MNFNEKSRVRSALVENSKLVELVPGGFHNLKPNDVSAYPRIVYQEVINRGKFFMDNQEKLSDIRFRISIFNTAGDVSSQTEIAKEVNSSLNAIGYTRYDSTDLFEEDEGVYHKVMKYQL